MECLEDNLGGEDEHTETHEFITNVAQPKSK